MQGTLQSQHKSLVIYELQVYMKEKGNVPINLSVKLVESIILFEVVREANTCCQLIDVQPLVGALY